MPYDVLVVGRPSCDLIFTGLPKWPEPGRESYASGAFIGAGGAFNAAAAASRLGFRVGFIGLIGNDMWSDFVLEQFAAEGVSTEFLEVVDRPLPAVSVALNVNGDRGFVTHEAEPEHTDRELFAYTTRVLAATEARHVHLHLVCGLPEIAEAARRRDMTLTVDAWGWEPWLCSDAVRKLIPIGDVLLTNEPEAQLLTGATDTRAALAELSEIAPYVVVKCGAAGSVAAVRGEVFEVSTEAAKAHDATGAGDCFNAGFMYGWLRRLDPATCLALGNLCGRRCVESVGGYHGCPREAELLELAAAAGIAVAR
jgi:sugar/nucleoside kinase (ribokinase family)